MSTETPSLFARVVAPRMLIALAMGFASGLPLLLTGSTLQAWLKEGNVTLGNITVYTALAGLPYTLKFLWAPLFDRFDAPLGRRRGWLLVMQLLLIAAIVGLALQSPAPASLHTIAAVALAISFFSASQDILIDAYRRESLATDELSLGSALYVNGYRVGMLLAGGGGLILADLYSFRTMYVLMAAAMAIGILTTLLAPEPKLEVPPPRSLRAAVIEPFTSYFQRPGAVTTLIFILLYKLGDNMAGQVTTLFYLDLGFTKTEIGAVVKFWGFWATIAGATLGGFLVLKIGLARALLFFGIGQMLSTGGFAVLAQLGHNIAALAAVVAFENFTAGMGSAAFIGFMGALTDKRFTATQYALLSSLMGVPRVILSAPTGLMATMMGWTNFFLFCTVIALPGLWLARRAGRWLEDAAHIEK